MDSQRRTSSADDSLDKKHKRDLRPATVDHPGTMLPDVLWVADSPLRRDDLHLDVVLHYLR